MRHPMLVVIFGHVSVLNLSVILVVLSEVGFGFDIRAFFACLAKIKTVVVQKCWLDGDRAQVNERKVTSSPRHSSLTTHHYFADALGSGSGLRVLTSIGSTPVPS